MQQTQRRPIVFRECIECHIEPYGGREGFRARRNVQVPYHGMSATGDHHREVPTVVPILPKKVPTMVPDSSPRIGTLCIGLPRFATNPRSTTVAPSGDPVWSCATERVATHGLPSSGGHGTRTRNRLPGTTFPVWPLAIRLPSRCFLKLRTPLFLRLTEKQVGIRNQPKKLRPKIRLSPVFDARHDRDVAQ